MTLKAWAFIILYTLGMLMGGTDDYREAVRQEHIEVVAK